MQEVFYQILGYVRAIWRYRWYIHLIAWPVCILGWYMVHTLPDQYESSARVFVDTDSMLRPLLKGLAVQTDLSEQVLVMTRTLLSRPNLEKVVKMTDMDIDVKTPDELEGLLKRLEKRVTISGERVKNLFRIQYTNKDPQLSHDVVQSLLTIFVESSLGDSRKDTDAAQQFLNEQIKEYESRLLAAEERLKDFKQKNIGFMPKDGKEYFTRLQEAMAELNHAKLSLREQIKRRDELRKQQIGEEPVFGIGQTTQTFEQDIRTPYDARIEELRKRLEDASLTFTEMHPDVRNTKHLLDQLEQKREEEVVRITKEREQLALSGSGTALEKNPVYQQIKISLRSAEVQVATLQTRVEEFQQRVNRLQNLVDTVPQVEAELARLNRDYEVHKRHYEILVERRESAVISEQAERSSDGIKFKIVDPPRVPIAPVGPNRLLFSAVVLLAGIGIGVVFAFFLSQLKPTFDDRTTIKDVLGLPVLGTVSMVWSERQKVKNKLEAISFGVVFIALVSVFATYAAIQKLAPELLKVS